MNPLELLGSKLMLLSQVLSFLFPVMFAVDPTCNYYQNMEVGPTYYVYNREYPQYYPRNQNCLWIAVAPQGYAVEATCQFEIPNSVDCVDERVLISRTGETDLGKAEVLCGFGNKTFQSESSKISIGLMSSYQSKGGRFLCSLQAKPASPPPQCDCGWKNTRRIVGGVETKINEYPMMAALIDRSRDEEFCGATIIASTYAVTAAHCFNKKDPSFVVLVVGDHNITTGTETDATRSHRLIKFIQHPEYNEDNKQNDIGIVQTEIPIQYSWAVGPACLPFYYYQESFAGQTVDALGWGTTEFTGPSSEVLLKTELDVLNYQDCYNTVQGTINQLCTFRSGHDACQKDSGGPILWFDDNSFRIHLVGIISYGYGCATSRPAINTRVTSYLMWITSVTPDAQYCVKGP